MDESIPSEETTEAAPERLNTFWLTMILSGKLIAQQALASGLGMIAHRVRRSSAGDALPSNPNIAVFRLAEWSDDYHSRAVLADIIPKITALIPLLQQLRSQHHASITLSLSTFRETDMGGIEFPPEFIRTIANAELPFGISIQARFLWGDDED